MNFWSTPPRLPAQFHHSPWDDDLGTSLQKSVGSTSTLKGAEITSSRLLLLSVILPGKHFLLWVVTTEAIHNKSNYWALNVSLTNDDTPRLLANTTGENHQ
jgi:hypothetical protein